MISHPISEGFSFGAQSVGVLVIMVQRPGFNDRAATRAQPTRLEVLHSALTQGTLLQLVALGGSTTWGHGMQMKKPLVYHQRLLKWIKEQFPEAQDSHLALNSGTAATGPQYVEKCLASHLLPAPNLVLIEFTQNLENHLDELGLERLLRRLLLLPSLPAIVVVSLPNCREGMPMRCFPVRHEGAVKPLAAHYGLPMIVPFGSTKEAVLADPSWLMDIPSERPPNGKGTHASEDGHARIAGALQQLLLDSWRANATSVASTKPYMRRRQQPPHPWPLPRPLFNRSAGVFESVQSKTGRWRGVAPNGSFSVRNYELAGAHCVAASELSSYALSHTKGWNYTTEGTWPVQKPGYVAHAAGETLDLCYDLTVACSSRGGGEGGGGDATADTADAQGNDAQDGRCPKAGTKLLLAIGYLKSYSAEMGDARVSCSGGCSCDRSTNDAVEPIAGWHHSHTSITWIDWISVTLAQDVQPPPRQRTLEWTAESCPCVVHVKTFESMGWASRQGITGPFMAAQLSRKPMNLRNATPAYKFKINSMMVSHQGDMSWIDPFKAREMPIRRRS